MTKAVVLLSGGLDSATALAVTKGLGLEPYALSFHYGQRHAAELTAARAIAEHQGVAAHEIVTIDLRAFGGSALTADLPVPEGGPTSSATSPIPITYVPARNTIFLAFALAWDYAQSTYAHPAATWILFGLYVFFTTVLFVTVPWSKFAHMFFKPTVAYQRRVEEANGSSDLPRPTTQNHIVRS